MKARNLYRFELKQEEDCGFGSACLNTNELVQYTF